MRLTREREQEKRRRKRGSSNGFIGRSAVKRATVPKEARVSHVLTEPVLNGSVGRRRFRLFIGCGANEWLAYQ